MDKFNYKSFSEEMALQAMNLIPEDVSDEGKKYLIKTIENFTYLAGEAIENDTTIKLSLNNKIVLTQIIAEWTFHKSVDLARSNVPTQYWDGIMQQIAFTIYEITKQGMIKEINQDDLLAAIENNVIKVWKKCLEELEEKKHIDKDCSTDAQNLSNIDNMAEAFHSIDNTQKPKSKPKKSINILKILKPKIKFFIYSLIIIALGIVLWYFKAELLSYILSHKQLILATGITGAIVGSIVYFITQKEIEYQLNELEETRQQLQNLVDPCRMYERLGVDILCLQVGAGLLSIADPDQDGELLAKIAALRQRLTDELGYIIPNIRIMDSSELDHNEYCISVRNNKVANGFVYPDKYMVIADEWDRKFGEMPENALYGVGPCYQEQAYWLEKEQVEDKPQISASDPVDVIITHLREVVINYVDSILTTVDIDKYIVLAKSTIEISNRLHKEDIRKIFVNLIREKVSIKDIILIFDRLNDLSRTLTDSDRLSEKIRQVLAQQICIKHANESNTIYAVKLDEKWKIILEHRLEWTEDGKYFYFTEEQRNELIENTALTLMRAHQDIGEQPAIICPSKIRLPLYKLLVDYIPTVVVLAETEILPSFKIDEVGIIEKY